MAILKRNPADMLRKRWSKRLSDEVSFWTTFYERGDCPETEAYRRLIAHGANVREHLQQLMRVPEGSRVDILDVGAGPASIVGSVWQGREIVVTAIDPLAAEYNSMLDRLGVTPPIQTRLGHAERLLEQFEPESFDLVYSCNALDHSYDPISSIEQMYALVRKGGLVRLEHNVNEGKHQRYRGLHQWNFDNVDGRFLLWNKKRRHFVDTSLPLAAEITCETCDPVSAGEPYWLNVSIRKPA